MRKGNHKSSMLKTLFAILVIFEVLILIFVYVYNTARAKERKFNLLNRKRALLLEEIRTLKYKKAKLLSTSALDNYAKKNGLVSIRPEEVIVLEKSGNTWKVIKNEKTK
ncbi:MAG: hypothetical protein J7L62_03805 [Candidatus Aminicenantes bacterium]|nr:hypothetical protein [Candidatus Aminicenantes bacterium]